MKRRNFMKLLGAPATAPLLVQSAEPPRIDHSLTVFALERERPDVVWGEILLLTRTENAIIQDAASGQPIAFTMASEVVVAREPIRFRPDWIDDGSSWPLGCLKPERCTTVFRDVPALLTPTRAVAHVRTPTGEVEVHIGNVENRQTAHVAVVCGPIEATLC